MIAIKIHPQSISDEFTGSQDRVWHSLHNIHSHSYRNTSLTSLSGWKTTQNFSAPAVMKNCQNRRYKEIKLAGSIKEPARKAGSADWVQEKAENLASLLPNVCLWRVELAFWYCEYIEVESGNEVLSVSRLMSRESGVSGLVGTNWLLRLHPLS